MENLIKQIKTAIVIGATISIVGYGLPLGFSIIDRPQKREFRDMNKDGRNDIIAYNPLGKRLNPKKFAGNTFYAIDDSSYVSGRGRAERNGDKIIIYQFPYKPIEFDLNKGEI